MMSHGNAAPPRVRPRQSLSGRLWLLTTLAVLLSEVVVFPPYIAHERYTWLTSRLEDASIAAAAAGSTLDPSTRDDLLRLVHAEAIRLTSDGKTIVLGSMPASVDTAIDLRTESPLDRVRRALHAVVWQQEGLMHLMGRSQYGPAATIELWLHERALGQTLRVFAGEFAGLSLLIAGVTGALMYLAVLVLLVRPMRRITGSIAAFRTDPERTVPLDPDGVTVLPNDEMAIAGRELAAMQHELRAALWRNARLAALGTVVAKVSHDLRGILTPALLSAERLQMHADPRVQRSGEVLAQAVDRATDLVRRTLDYAREGPPPLELAPVALAPLVTEAAEAARPRGSRVRLMNTVDPAFVVRADRMQLFRVLFNLLRNAAEAGAQRVAVSARAASPMLAIEIVDDGPGLPEAVRAGLFRPFAGSMRRDGTGLGLAIARDLTVAHGGEIELVETSEAGTTFRLTLRLAEPARSAEPATDDARVAPATTADV